MVELGLSKSNGNCGCDSATVSSIKMAAATSLFMLMSSNTNEQIKTHQEPSLENFINIDPVV